MIRKRKLEGSEGSERSVVRHIQGYVPPRFLLISISSLAYSLHSMAAELPANQLRLISPKPSPADFSPRKWKTTLSPKSILSKDSVLFLPRSSQLQPLSALPGFDSKSLGSDNDTFRIEKLMSADLKSPPSLQPMFPGAIPHYTISILIM